MSLLGYIVCAAGLVGLVLSFSGLDQSIPPLANLGIPVWVWLVVAVAGGALGMFTRQTRD